MIDIVSEADGQDIGTFDTQTIKAANILSVQIGNLEYAQTLGIDLRYFLSEDFKFQNESFRAYLVETLANWGINVASITEQMKALYDELNINLNPEELSSGFVAR